MFFESMCQQIADCPDILSKFTVYLTLTIWLVECLFSLNQLYRVFHGTLNSLCLPSYCVPRCHTQDDIRPQTGAAGAVTRTGIGTVIEIGRGTVGESKGIAARRLSPPAARGTGGAGLIVKREAMHVLGGTCVCRVSPFPSMFFIDCHCYVFSYALAAHDK